MNLHLVVEYSRINETRRMKEASWFYFSPLEGTMPHRPHKPCSYPGCPNLTTGRYCSLHQKIQNAMYDRLMRSRPASEFYHSREWKRKRSQFLLEHPFCEECRKNGRLTKATLVDHIVPIRQGGSLLDDGNLQALCSSCHSRKSIEEGSRFGKL